MAKRESSRSLTMCTICTATMAADDMFMSSSCSHSFCANCIASHIDAKLKDNVANVTCPAPNCEASLEQEAVCEAMTMQLAETMNWKRCPRCKIYVERAHGCSHIICCMCGFEFCYLCGVQWGGTHGCHP